MGTIQVLHKSIYPTIFQRNKRQNVSKSSDDNYRKRAKNKDNERPKELKILKNVILILLVGRSVMFVKTQKL